MICPFCAEKMILVSSVECDFKKTKFYICKSCKNSITTIEQPKEKYLDFGEKKGDKLCPRCGGKTLCKTKQSDIKRWRECVECGWKNWTYEKIVLSGDELREYKERVEQ